MTKELGSHVVYTFKFYPQGNTINESSHNGLAATIRASLEMGSALDQVLTDALAVYNTTPHLAMSLSPHFTLFGAEPTLHGW